MDDSKVIVRHNTVLTIYSIATKERVQQLQIGSVYDEQPCCCHDNKYIEVSQDHISELDLGTSKKRVKKVRFEQELDSPSSFQAGAYMYVFNVGHLYVVELGSLSLFKGFVVPNARHATMTILGPSELGLYTFDDECLYVIDTQLLGCRKIFFRAPLADG